VRAVPERLHQPSGRRRLDAEARHRHVHGRPRTRLDVG
jgi:hypothetical protein